jgi:hypothetical protein
MFSIAVYDKNIDEARAIRELIQDYIVEQETIIKVSLFTNLEEVLLAPASYDIYIMDHSAILIAKQIIDMDAGSRVLILGENFEEASMASELGMDYFLLKPVKKEAFFHILKKIKKQIREDSIVLKTSYGEKRIKLNNLNYIDIVKRCLCYHLRDGSILDGQTLRTSYEKAINPLDKHECLLFLAPSLLINLSQIDELHDDHVVFEDKDVCYFPKKAKDIVKERWHKYLNIE